MLAIAIYTFLALRRCHPQRWFTIVLKMVLLFFGYLIALMVTMAIALFITSLTL